MQRYLAADEGIYAEASSVLSLAAIKHFVKQGSIDPDRSIVAVLTSSASRIPRRRRNTCPRFKSPSPRSTGSPAFSASTTTLRFPRRFSPPQNKKTKTIMQSWPAGHSPGLLALDLAGIEPLANTSVQPASARPEPVEGPQPARGSAVTRSESRAEPNPRSESNQAEEIAPRRTDKAAEAIAAAEAGRTDVLAWGCVPARSRASSPGEWPAGHDCIIVSFNRLIIVQVISSSASISTGISKGRAATPTAERAC